jgi:hypothetical protein
VKTWLERLGVLLLGAALGWAGSTLLPAGEGGDGAPPNLPAAGEDARARSTALAEDRFRTEMNIALAGFLRLIEFRDFGRRGRDVALVVPVDDQAGRADVLDASARRGIRIPRIVVDTAARRSWAIQGERLEQLQGEVDPDVDAAFGDILEFLEQHPIPNSTALAVVAGSEWSRPAVVDRWVDLNDNLVATSVAVMSRFGEGP